MGSTFEAPGRVRRAAWLVLEVVLAVNLAAPSRAAQRRDELKRGKIYYRYSRVQVRLNSEWRFKRQAAPGTAVEAEFIGAEKPEYDDSSWATVHLPHTWDQSEIPFPGPGHFRGLGWYRRKLEAPREWESRRVWLEFKGVFQIAEVWVNGRYVGRHVGGFTGFEFDLTDYLKWEASNLLAVRVNDVLDPDVAPANETNVTVYGGIYRSVALLITSPLRIATNGVRVRPERSGDGVSIQVSTAVENDGNSPGSFRLETLIVDAADQPVATLRTQTGGVEPHRREVVGQEADVLLHLRLWSPDSPYLYRLISTLHDGDRPADRAETSFGVRFMDYDPAKGFTLNGEPINLHGVNRRQDYGFLGDAVPEAVGRRDIRLIKTMGANFMRTSHYPQDPAVLDECDRLGVLVWEEIPNIKIQIYPPAPDNTEPVYTQRFRRGLMANLKQQMREMIERDTNHPSIIIWGLGDDLSTYHFPEDFVELSSAAHSLDPTRWTAGRSPHVTDVTDATSEPQLVREHQGHPERRYIWNEWGSFASERGLEGAPYYSRLPADPLSDVSLGDSDAAQLLEGYLMQWNALPWLGTAKWCMFDTGELNATRTRSLWDWPYPDGRVTFRWPFDDYLGVADMWRLPKNSYYLLQSQWTDKPMLHIAGHWTWPGQEGRKRRVRVYSNCDTVELFLNGRSLGHRRPATAGQIWEDFRRSIGPYQSPDEFNQQPLPGAALRHPPFIWDDVPYEAGTLTAIGRQGNVTVQDEARTAGKAARISLKAEKDTLIADEEDVSFIEADVVDAEGVIVPDARPWIQFSVDGPGRLLGGATEIDAIAGVAAINVQSTGRSGEVRVAASAEGLASGAVRLQGVKK